MKTLFAAALFAATVAGFGSASAMTPAPAGQSSDVIHVAGMAAALASTAARWALAARTAPLSCARPCADAASGALAAAFAAPGGKLTAPPYKTPLRRGFLLETSPLPRCPRKFRGPSTEKYFFNCDGTFSGSALGRGWPVPASRDPQRAPGPAKPPTSSSGSAWPWPAAPGGLFVAAHMASSRVEAFGSVALVFGLMILGAVGLLSRYRYSAPYSHCRTQGR